MKLWKHYLRLHLRSALLYLLFCAVFTVSFLLYRLPPAAVLYPALLCAVIGLTVWIADFLRVRREHAALQRIRTHEDAMAGSFPEARSIPEEDCQNAVRLLCEQYTLGRAEQERRYADMVDYYTVWAHQIKTPISAMRLQLQNTDSPLSRSLTADLHRIEQYVEMVMTFLRLNSESTDYVFREYDLDRLVKRSVRKFSSEFIGRRLQLVYKPFQATVVTDEKWLSFVIEQVLSNALKYTDSGSITVSLEPGPVLRIRDTGIGIAPEDLPRIFENGYTGCNGRIHESSSGLGLYLCRRICQRLGLTITASSAVGAGTAIDIGLAQTGPVTE